MLLWLKLLGRWILFFAACIEMVLLSLWIHVNFFTLNAVVMYLATMLIMLFVIRELAYPVSWFLIMFTIGMHDTGLNGLLGNLLFGIIFGVSRYGVLLLGIGLTKERQI